MCCYGVVVLNVYVSVFEYWPVRSGSLASMRWLNWSVTAARDRSGRIRR